MDIDFHLGTGILVADGDDALTVFIRVVLAHSEHNRRSAGASCLHLGAARCCRHRYPVATVRNRHIVTDVALQIDGYISSLHLHIEGIRIDLECGREWLGDRNLDFCAGLLVADHDNSLTILIGLVLCHFQFDGCCLRGPCLRRRGASDPVAVVRNLNIIADVALQIDGDCPTLHRHLEGFLVGIEHRRKGLMNLNLDTHTSLLVANGDDTIASLVALILLNRECDGLGL